MGQKSFDQYVADVAGLYELELRERAIERDDVVQVHVVACALFVAFLQRNELPAVERHVLVRRALVRLHRIVFGHRDIPGLEEIPAGEFVSPGHVALADGLVAGMSEVLRMNGLTMNREGAVL